MKIDLTKDEWEFLKKSMKIGIALLESNFPDEYKQSQTYKFNEKLGSEWIDDE